MDVWNHILSYLPRSEIMLTMSLISKDVNYVISKLKLYNEVN